MIVPFLRRLAPSALAFTLVLGLAASPGGSARASGAAKRWVCPPCSSPCDTTTFPAPGTCPVCGMALVEAASQAAAPDPGRRKVAILLFDAVEIVDSMGPYEMFGAANCDVYTVAATRTAVTSAMGQTLVPRYDFATAPTPDVLVVPGGGVQAASHDEATLRFVRETAAQAPITLSVCNGAFILAQAGLLDGLTATTTAGNIATLAGRYPKIHVVRDRRYVDNGRIVTAAGLSAGMDGALHVIARLFGTGYAQQVALGEEYPWQPEGGFARAAMADQQIPDLPLDGHGTWDLQRTEGDQAHWKVVVNGTPTAGAATFIGSIEDALSGQGWTRVRASGTWPATRFSAWRFTGNDGRTWSATLRFAPVDAAARALTATLSLKRSGS